MRANASFLAAIGFGAALFMPSGPAVAEWKVVHGHSGRIEDPTASAYAAPKGWGLEINPPTAAVNWVHYDMPASTAGKARCIKMMFFAGPNGSIGRLHVWNGPVPVKAFDNLNWVGPGWLTRTIDLGTDYTFSLGLGISVMAMGLPDVDDDGIPDDYRVIISSVFVSDTAGFGGCSSAPQKQ